MPPFAWAKGRLLTRSEWDNPTASGGGRSVRFASPAIAAILVCSAFQQASAQMSSGVLVHIDDLARMNQRLRERNLQLEGENAELRARLRQLGDVEAPAASAAPAAPTLRAAPTPLAAPAAPPARNAPRVERGPLPAIVPSVSAPATDPEVAINGVIDLSSDPEGATAQTSLGASCETPCAMEVSADGPFTVTFTRAGYAPTMVSVRIQPGQPGVSDPKFAPNPVFAQLARAGKPKSAKPMATTPAPRP
jgi:hypothetical protein